MNTLTTDQLAAMLTYASGVIVDNEDLLCSLDRNIGDGDHGLGMARGYRTAAAEIATTHHDTVGSLLNAFGEALVDSMGGASGVLNGQLFVAGASRLAGVKELTVDGWAQLVAAGLADIQKRGGAAVGDKTMVDALVPASQALADAAAQHDSFPQALHSAAGAARAGAASTSDFRAKYGKAHALGDRAIGHVDAGATSMSLLFGAFADWAANGERA
ncbi:dihydroxyacetone kinase subunit DhaL [Microbacterium aerolatum]|uniref:Dihydroxyacetone kinase subunit L n=1 Tax=Microbacterium aerolatum TaxID=153731 RepID=A0A511ABX6_9MICO|nr:dihydroxyacetone kinase subunit DhaL [Microbacterium aerolatum]GEK85678.1 dihydroxyacetone kinase subunit L [Microbacterium aerolatum]GGB21251.1 dihydroxyacetone kinase subunit L [Microbacterium aerolatum]